jgi:hypothetical protein
MEMIRHQNMPDQAPWAGGFGKVLKALWIASVDNTLGDLLCMPSRNRSAVLISNIKTL